LSEHIASTINTRKLIVNLFERAARGKWRFTTQRGEITAEQLFDLPLEGNNGFNLNEVAIAVDNQLETSARKNFVEPVKNTARAELEGKLELIKLVIASKLADMKASETRVKNAAERQRILDALNAKSDEELKSATKEELEERLAALESD
jgi:hypothetical protein